MSRKGGKKSHTRATGGCRGGMSSILAIVTFSELIAGLVSQCKRLSLELTEAKSITSGSSELRNLAAASTACSLYSAEDVVRPEGFASRSRGAGEGPVCFSALSSDSKASPSDTAG